MQAMARVILVYVPPINPQKIIFSRANTVTPAHFMVHAGNGETDTGLHTIFKAAWEADAAAPVPLYGAGQNIIPAMHVTDFAAYVAAVCQYPPPQQYLLAADDSCLTQREVITAIAQKLGDVPVKEHSLEELYFQEVLCLCYYGKLTQPAFRYCKNRQKQVKCAIESFFQRQHLKFFPASMPGVLGLNPV